jgi:hypothetical protein
MSERIEVCKTCFLLAKKRNSGLRSGLNDRFYANGLKEVWEAFDALLGERYNAKTEKDMRKKFSNIYQSDFINWKTSDQFKESLNKLASLSPVKNMKTGIDILLSDIRELFQVLNFCYAIRSNLFHGAKDLIGTTSHAKRNRELVEYAFKVTYEILEIILPYERVVI